MDNVEDSSRAVTRDSLVSIDDIMTEPVQRDRAGGEAETAYMYMFEADGRQFVFIRNLGTGVDCVAQLVKDIGTGTNLVRKVSCHRLRRMGLVKPGEEELPPYKKPNEIRILTKINTTFKAPEVGIPRYIVDCYGHEYIKSKHVSRGGSSMYHSVSYWKLCNGQSVKIRWQGPEVDPPTIPTSILARMIRQILSTFYWLYTAGDQPLYHGDVHNGNIWLHWPDNSMLPDFYLGDFGHAHFADNDRKTFLRSNLAPAPVADLYQFHESVYSLVIDQSNGEGHHGLGRRSLRQLCDTISKVIDLWKSTSAHKTPPDLKPLIKFAQNFEDQFGKGGAEDETESEMYVTFMTKERKMALQTEQDDPFVVVTANIEEALNPTVMNKAGVEVRREIHGPWILVTDDGYMAEGEPVTHHRPNPGDLDPHDIKGLSRSVSRRQANKQYLFSRSGHTSMTFPFSSGDPMMAGITPCHSWGSGDSDRFEVSRLGPHVWIPDTTTAPANMNWQELTSYVNKALKTAGVKIRRTVAPSSLEDKARRWHALLHGANCECDDKVWMVDMENELKQARMARVVGNMQVAAFDWHEHD